MRQRLALLAVAAAFASTAGAITPLASAAQVIAAKTCSASYVHAFLPWGEKCLRAGEFCKVGNAAYRLYGFVCPLTGHLRRR